MNNQKSWENYKEFWVNFASNLTDEEKLLFSTIPKNGWYPSNSIPYERNTKYCFQVSTQKQQMAVFIIIEASDELINKRILDQVPTHLLPSEPRFALQKIRGKMQEDFRNILLKIYGCTCAVCGLSIEVALEAAHIIPYSKANEEQRVDPQNGILLCAVHHKLFDRGIIKINEHYELYCQNEVVVTEYDQLMLTPFHQKELSLPHEKEYLPNKEYLKNHRAKS